MTHKESMVNLTRELLRCGVFNHLPDQEVSTLHRLIMQLQLAPFSMLPNALFSFWYKGDYYNDGISQHLLQHCNEYLQRMQQPLIDVYAGEWQDA